MKKIIVLKSTYRESGFGYWIHNYSVSFSGEKGYFYSIKASEEGFDKTAAIWAEAGYTIEYIKAI